MGSNIKHCCFGRTPNKVDLEKLRRRSSTVDLRLYAMSSVQGGPGGQNTNDRKVVYKGLKTLWGCGCIMVVCGCK